MIPRGKRGELFKKKTTGVGHKRGAAAATHPNATGVTQKYKEARPQRPGARSGPGVQAQVQLQATPVRSWGVLKVPHTEHHRLSTDIRLHSRAGAQPHSNLALETQHTG